MIATTRVAHKSPVEYALRCPLGRCLGRSPPSLPSADLCGRRLPHGGWGLVSLTRSRGALTRYPASFAVPRNRFIAVGGQPPVGRETAPEDVLRCRRPGLSASGLCTLPMFRETAGVVSWLSPNAAGIETPAEHHQDCRLICWIRTYDGRGCGQPPDRTGDLGQGQPAALMGTTTGGQRVGSSIGDCSGL